MKSSTVANVKSGNAVDHNNLFLQTLAHNVANSAGTNGFIPYGQYSLNKSQNELLFEESINTGMSQYRNSTTRPLTASHFSQQKRISMFNSRDSFKDSKA
jgi:hypothetical protein